MELSVSPAIQLELPDFMETLPESRESANIVPLLQVCLSLLKRQSHISFEDNVFTQGHYAAQPGIFTGENLPLSPHLSFQERDAH